MTTSAPAVSDVLDGPIAFRTTAQPARSARPTAVFLHGLGGDRHSWEPQLAALADRRRCCAWEQPGYGHSPGLVESLPALATVAADWIATLADGPVDVVGLSFGGMVAQHLALDHPHLVRSLALLDTSPAFGLDGVTTRESWLASRVADPAAGPAPRERIVDGLVGDQCPPEVRARVVDAMTAIPAPSLAAASRALVDHDTRARLAEINVPTLVLVGTDDDETPPAYAQEIHRRIARSRYVVVPGCGHLANVEAPDAVNTELAALWSDAEEAGR